MEFIHEKETIWYFNYFLVILSFDLLYNNIQAEQNIAPLYDGFMLRKFEFVVQVNEKLIMHI